MYNNAIMFSVGIRSVRRISVKAVLNICWRSVLMSLLFYILLF